jgi:hypothetical protein
MSSKINQSMKALTIFLDFDGTVVEHTFPEIYAANPNCIAVLRKLQSAGHSIILNTYRAELGAVYMEAAVDFFNQVEFELKPLEDINQFKIIPPAWNLEESISTGVLFIDDIAEGIPLTPNRGLKEGFTVDWMVLDEVFAKAGVYRGHK